MSLMTAVLVEELVQALVQELEQALEQVLTSPPLVAKRRTFVASHCR